MKNIKYIVIAVILFILTCFYVGINLQPTEVVNETEQVDSLRIELDSIDRYFQIEIMKKKDSLFNAYNSKITEEAQE